MIQKSPNLTGGPPREAETVLCSVFTFVVTTLVDAATAKNKQEHIRVVASWIPE